MLSHGIIKHQGNRKCILHETRALVVLFVARYQGPSAQAVNACLHAYKAAENAHEAVLESEQYNLPFHVQPRAVLILSSIKQHSSLGSIEETTKSRLVVGVRLELLALNQSSTYYVALHVHKQPSAHMHEPCCSGTQGRVRRKISQAILMWALNKACGKPYYSKYTVKLCKTET